MITAKRDTEEPNRAGYALVLLESSGYVEPWKSEIMASINDSSTDEIELIIQDLLRNQVDRWSSYRQKDIDKRLKEKGC